MEPFSTIMLGILSNACYNLLQASTKLIFSDIKNSIVEEIKEAALPLPNIDLIESISKELETLEISEDDSPKKIQRVIESNSEVMLALKKLEDNISLKSNQSTITKTVTINNSGNGNMNFGNITQ